MCVTSNQYTFNKTPFFVSAISLQDLPADDNGTYRHNGMPTWVYEVENYIGGRIKKKMVAKTALKPDQLHRRGKLHNDQENIPQEQIL